jgi:transcriptional regulator with XRE-family HTH domain
VSDESKKTLPATETWKRSVREWLRDKGVTRADLARQVGCSKAAITQLLSESEPVHSSKLVPDICRVTGLEPPKLPLDRPEMRALLEWATLEFERDPENFARLSGILLAASEAEHKRREAQREHDEAMRQLEQALKKH